MSDSVAQLCRAPLFMGLSRQEYWSGLPCPPPGDLPNPWIEPWSPESPVLQVILYHWATEEAPLFNINISIFSYTSEMNTNWCGRQWHPTPVLLPGKSHGWRSLISCSPWGRKESDTTERLHFHFSVSRIGEGNVNPPVFLPGESQGWGSLVGCRLWGHTESDTTEVT